MDKVETADAEEVNLSHEELLEVTTTTLNELLQQDSFLSDLPKGVTYDEVNSQIALLYGRSITVNVARGDGDSMPIVVPQANSTVHDIKSGIKRFMNLKLQRQHKNKKRKISWRYVWKTYDLQFQGTSLKSNETKLSELGIKNKSIVSFVKKRSDRMGSRR